MKKNKIYEGKAKILYEGPDYSTLIQHFKDDATAFNNQKHSVFKGKGVLNSRISEFIYEKLALNGIQTHFIKQLNMKEQLIRKLDIIPVEFVVRQIVAGSLAKRLGLEKGKRLARPIVEFYYKDDTLGDPLISEEHIAVFEWLTSAELEEIINICFRVNDFLSGLFLGVNIILVDFKLEFGRLALENDTHDLILADEISPDTCRLWDLQTKQAFDKDLFRHDTGDLLNGYREVANRLGILEKEIQSSEGVHEFRTRI